MITENNVDDDFFDLKKKIACVPHDFAGICFAAWLISILTLWSVTGQANDQLQASQWSAVGQPVISNRPASDQQ